MARQIDLDARLAALMGDYTDDGWAESRQREKASLYLKVSRDLNAKMSRAIFILQGTGGDSWARCERALAVLEGRI